jgi:hypothetical protein
MEVCYNSEPHSGVFFPPKKCHGGYSLCAAIQCIAADLQYCAFWYPERVIPRKEGHHDDDMTFLCDYVIWMKGTAHHVKRCY